jgi:dihydropteroate synthase
VKKPYTLRIRQQLVTYERPLVMGILNATPDSFHPASRLPEAQAAVDRAGEMLQQGASILDIGGQSTRPGAQLVEATEELDRALPVVEAVLKAFPDVLISVDTFRSEVAKAALTSGAAMVNDVSAATLDEALLEVVAAFQVPYVLMHMTGIPAGAHTMREYSNVTREVVYFLSEKLAQLRRRGIADVIVDPGFGFGKNLANNCQLMRELDHLEVLEVPIMVGVSRKKMVQQLTFTDAEHALNGTTAAHAVALMKGAHILRVHDVREAVEAVNVVMALTKV